MSIGSGSATMAAMSEKRRSSDYLAFAGLIILGIVILWGLFHAAGLLAPWLTSIFPASSPKIAVTAPKTVTADEPFTLSWKYSPGVNGMYVFLYPCADNVIFETEGAGGGSLVVPCGAAFTVVPGTSEMELVPHLAKTDESSVRLTIAFIPDDSAGKARTEGSAIVTVQPGEKVAPKPALSDTSAPTKPTTSGKKKSPPDLTVKILSTSVDPVTHTGIVMFDIKNEGGSATGEWYFMANLPADGGYLYTSPMQVSLAPGDHIVNILRFEQPVPGAALIRVDPADLIHESNETNNEALTGYGAPQPTPYPYQY